MRPADNPAATFLLWIPSRLRARSTLAPEPDAVAEARTIARGLFRGERAEVFRVGDPPELVETVSAV